ncbi:MAG: hypothetical protein FGM37_04995 [Phycisphaerales bacterium]|nr:hypothetical protein [Phycisphaerales bacterium]
MSPSAWQPMVLIRHECGPASHWDWMLAPAECPRDPNAYALDSWRVAVPLHRMPPGDAVEIEQGPAHRVEYLSLESPRALSGDRGHVVPVARGWWRPASGVGWELRWDGQWTGQVTLSASPRGPTWRLLSAIRHQGP